jgi:hypothetical protein
VRTYKIWDLPSGGWRLMVWNEHGRRIAYVDHRWKWRVRLIAWWYYGRRGVRPV